MLKFTIPGEPKGKARPIVTRSGHAFTPRGTVIYENLVKISFQEKFPLHQPWDGEINCFIIAYFSIPKSASKKKRQEMLEDKMRPIKKPDLDNVAKAVLDSLNGIAFTDDSHVVSLAINKRYSETPRVEVMLWEGDLWKCHPGKENCNHE